MKKIEMPQKLVEMVSSEGMSELFGGFCFEKHVNNGTNCTDLNNGKNCDVINHGKNCSVINNKVNCAEINNWGNCSVKEVKNIG